jgi:hypothetical protein
VQPPIGAHGAETGLRLQEIVDCPHETGETGIVRPRLAVYAAQASLYTEAIKNAMGGDCTNIAVLLQRYLKFCQQLSHDADQRLKEWLACARARQRTFGGPGLRDSCLGADAADQVDHQRTEIDPGRSWKELGDGLAERAPLASEIGGAQS